MRLRLGRQFIFYRFMSPTPTRSRDEGFGGVLYSASANTLFRGENSPSWHVTVVMCHPSHRRAGPGPQRLLLSASPSG